MDSAGHKAGEHGAGVMIEVEDLHRSFDGVEVLRGVFLEIERGELLALIGRSGSGKSVLLKHMAGLLRPDKGSIWIAGDDISRLKGRRLSRLRERLGFLFQGGALFDSMNVYDNVAFPLREKTRLPEVEIRERVMEELALVGLKGAESKYPSQLSGGMQKRAALARELVAEPEIFMFDEPTTGLDPVIGQAILELIDGLHRRLGFTGVMVTHEIHRVFDIVDRAAFLHDGRIQAQGTPDAVLASEDPLVGQFVRGEVRGPMELG
ncbi:MAG: ABC transporter ATP-binding protein [Desulfobacteraceae bacterium]